MVTETERDSKMMVADKTSSPFGITRKDIDDLFEKYDQRNFIEECEVMEQWGGNSAIAKMLSTNLTKGITGDDKVQRESEFGSNKVIQEPLPHFCSYVWEQLGDFMLRILIVAAILQIGLGASPLSSHPETEWIDGVSILFAVSVVVTVGSITNYNKEKKFKSLNDVSLAMAKVTVCRNGVVDDKELADNLLVGDLISISTGDIVPCDGVIISSEGQIKIEESSLTGESDAIDKETLEVCIAKSKEFQDKSQCNKHSVASPLVFSGTLVKEGGGWFIALAVGPNSKKGKIQENVQQSQDSDDAKTPLEIKLDSIAEDVGIFGIIAAVLTFIALMIRFGISYSASKKAYDEFLENGSTGGNTITDPKKTVSGSIISILLLCLAIVVVAIPEGLPLAVTLSLAFSINKMMNDNNLVRKMHACETMGGANFICSDKTGTLTQNKMNIQKFFNGKEVIETSHITTNQEKRFPHSEIGFSDAYFDLFNCVTVCNLSMKITEDDETKQESKTDLGFSNFIKNINGKLYNTMKKYNMTDGSEIKRIAFSSARKKMSTIIESPELPTGYRVLMKGASEIVLKSVSHYLNPDNLEKIEKTDADAIRFKNEIIDKFANATLRTISVAYKDISKSEAENWKDTDSEGRNTIENSGFTMVCIVGIKDALREGVKEAIAKCHGAGINVVMVTGDLKETAIAISQECGIYSLKPEDPIPENYSLTGEEFYKAIGGLYCEVCGKDIKECEDPKTKREAKLLKKDEKEVQKLAIKNMDVFTEIQKDLRVLARSRPLDKYALVLGLRVLDHVVAVTGDGTNDAQALSKSDVGFAMGMEGTDIAKDAADIIIMDDNFASIVKAVIWGRNIYDNIRKFIQFQLTVNVTACLLVFVTACIGNEVPISAIQMLWLNLIMDSLGSLALATEPPHENLLNRQPNSRKQYIINYLMWKHILGQSLVLFIVLIVMYLEAPNFIQETEPYRIAEADLIFSCYGKYPGRAPDGGKHFILSGSSAQWSSNDLLIEGKTALDCGNYSEAQEMSIAFDEYKSAYGNTSHLTMIFNIFVFWTLFNQINARVIDDAINIFYNIQNNAYFIIIVIIECFLQAILIQFGSIAFSTSMNGITAQQWGICIGFSCLTFPTAFILKFIPLEKALEKIYLSCKCCKKNKVVPDNQNVKTEVKRLESDPNQGQMQRIQAESSKKKTLTQNLRRNSMLSDKQSSMLRGSKN